MKQYDTYLFDADGTLIDTTRLIIDCFRHTLPHFGIPLPDDDTIISHIGIPFETQLAFYTGPIDARMSHEIWRFYKDHQIEIYEENLSLFPGTMETLEMLKSQDRNLAVVTSRTRLTLDLYLKKLGILDLFSFTVTPEDVRLPKPDPEPTLLALEKFSSNPQDALFVGDAVYDCTSARQAGVDFAYVNWSHTPYEKFTYVTCRLDSMTDLLQSDPCANTAP
ncbi:MAG: HAD family hydrolase [Spirochaetota bacterium]